MIASLRRPAAVTPGQTMTQGTRVPPSNSVALPPRNGALLVGVVPSISSYMLPPLSEVKTMIVRSASLQAVERVEQRADGVVHALDHRGVGRAALRIGGIHAGAVLLDQRLLGIEGRVDAEHPVVQVERPVPVSPPSRPRLRRPCGLRCARRARGHGNRRTSTARRSSPPAPARHVRHVHVEALLQRRIRLRAEMPLAEVPRGVARLLQRLGQRAVLGLQPRRRHGLDRLLVRRRGFPGVASSTTCGTWQFGVVMPVRAGLRPVRMADRVGEQSGLAE